MALKSSDFTRLINNDEMSQIEIRLVISDLVGSVVSDLEAQEMFNSLTSHIRKSLDYFNNLLYTGFSPFSEKDVFDFLLTDTQFSLSFKKVKGQGVLHGFDHADARRHLVNGLPEKIRESVLRRKLEATGVFTKDLLVHLGAPLSWGEDVLDKIVSIRDIGMGSSLYLIDLGEGQWVLKKREHSYQSFFSEFLDVLEWPSFKSFPVINNTGRWDVMEYVGGQTLGNLLLEDGCDDLLLRQAAQHAALGDVLGRGDRHFQNYMVNKGALYPIDLHFLFWEDNESWVSRYLSAGMSEYAILILWSEKQDYQKKSALFFEAYKETVVLLQDEKLKIVSFIKRFFGPSHETDRRCKYVLSRLMNEDYVETQKARYIKDFEIYKKRLKYKNVLEQMGQRYPTILKEYPVLKMYYYADKDKLSAFFIAEESGYDGVYELLETLSKKLLSLPEGFFTEE
jgi:hypothetical protein